jgi:CPA1 family monovalent cation:H+ antiporter
MPSLEIGLELLLVALAVALITRRSGHPYTIALVIWGLVLGVFGALEPLGLSKELVLSVFLPPLLFEGAVQIRVDLLRRRAGLVLLLAFAGTALSALAVGAAAWLLLGFEPLIALLLGAMVAPTDPVSVLASFRALGVRRDLSTIVEAESLFNDGVAVVLYVSLLAAIGGESVTLTNAALDFLFLVVGGAVLGGVVGLSAARLLARVDDHLIAISATIVVAYGAYVLAEHVGVSGVLAVALAGLAFGQQSSGRLSAGTRERVDSFWEIVVFLVNSVLFLLIGFELHLDRLAGELSDAVLLVGVLLATRTVIVGALGLLVDWRRGDLPRRWRPVIVWAGLRGAVPIALALGLPADLPDRGELVAIVFGIVLISLVGQGLTMPFVLRRAQLGGASEPAPEAGSADGSRPA